MAIDKSMVGQTTALEFGGIPGAFFMTFGLPIGVYALNIMCNKESCLLWPLPALSSDFIVSLFSWEACCIFIGWFSFQIILHLILPFGTIAQGLPLRTGKRLMYKCNGFAAFVISLLSFAAMFYNGFSMNKAYALFLPLATAATIFSYFLSIYLYARALLAKNQDLSHGGNSGWHIYDFFMGRELNPRIGALDLKFFCEMRPGLIGWVILDLCFLAEAYKTHGYLPTQLVMVVLFHTLYVADALWYEEAILTTMDIVHEGFGLMLAFGDLVWVPFLYSLQARYILEHPTNWSTSSLAGILCLNMLGYYIFRSSNSEKNEFRNDPNSAAMQKKQTLSTTSGKKLLVSGWWGLCRHPNYMGDLIMAFSWSLVCGFESILPYFYPIYFLVLLIHRFERDNVMCRKKYGKDWDIYCKRVPYKIFPFIY